MRELIQVLLPYETSSRHAALCVAVLSTKVQERIVAVTALNYFGFVVASRRG